MTTVIVVFCLFEGVEDGDRESYGCGFANALKDVSESVFEEFVSVLVAEGIGDKLVGVR